METLPLERAYTLLESGPVTLIATHDGRKPNLMTVTWTMVTDFSPTFALATGPWNYSYGALRDRRECVIAIPDAGMIDTAIGIGMCSGADTDKFAKFGLTPERAQHVGAPLVRECLANIECRVVDLIERHGIVVLEGLAAHIDPAHAEKRVLHAVGDGTFIVDGERIDRREAMRAKLPAGVL